MHILVTGVPADKVESQQCARPRDRTAFNDCAILWLKCFVVDREISDDRNKIHAHWNLHICRWMAQVGSLPSSARTHRRVLAWLPCESDEGTPWSAPMIDSPTPVRFGSGTGSPHSIRWLRHLYKMCTGSI